MRSVGSNQFIARLHVTDLKKKDSGQNNTLFVRNFRGTTSYPFTMDSITGRQGSQDWVFNKHHLTPG